VVCLATPHDPSILSSTAHTAPDPAAFTFHPCFLAPTNSFRRLTHLTYDYSYAIQSP